jgi:hypothetical protein
MRAALIVTDWMFGSIPPPAFTVNGSTTPFRSFRVLSDRPSAERFSADANASFRLRVSLWDVERWFWAKPDQGSFKLSNCSNGS